MPSIFNQMDQDFMTSVKGKKVSELPLMNPELAPDAVIKYVHHDVASKVFQPDPEIDVFMNFRGETDMQAVDENGNMYILDHKSISHDELSVYDMTMHAYLYSVENPHNMMRRKVLGLGLLCWRHDHYQLEDNAFVGKLKLAPIEIRKKEFSQGIKAVAHMLNNENPPESGEGCDICTFLDAHKSKGSLKLEA